MLRYVNGDIKTIPTVGNKLTIICQQVNCRGVMGAGLAKQIADTWPVVRKDYKSFCSDTKNPSVLLGEYQIVKVQSNLAVANIFGQLNYGRDKRYTNYYAISIAFYNLFKRHPEAIFRIPYQFGCGLAGGDWNKVSAIIEKAAKQWNADVEIWKL